MKATILEELTNLANSNIKQSIIESRAPHVISSVIYLIEQIELKYGVDEADTLKRKLMNSIKTKDSSKFLKAVRRSKGKE
jgi:hypothetical protein